MVVLLVGCSVVLVPDCVVSLREGMVVVGLVVFVTDASVVLVNFTESVVMSCRGVSGDT